VQDFLTKILDAKELFLYQGGRGKPLLFTGHFGKIKQMKLKHRSKIKGKKNSKTKYYYEVELEENFNFQGIDSIPLEPKILFDKNDTSNKTFLKKYLPAITTIEKIELNIKHSSLAVKNN